MIKQTLHDLPDIGGMLLDQFRDDQNVVQIHKDLIIKQVSEHVIHEMLEGRRCISQTGRHDQAFKMTVSSSKCGLPFVAFFDSDQIVGTLEVHFGEYLGLA